MEQSEQKQHGEADQQYRERILHKGLRILLVSTVEERKAQHDGEIPEGRQQPAQLPEQQFGYTDKAVIFVSGKPGFCNKK